MNTRIIRKISLIIFITLAFSLILIQLIASVSSKQPPDKIFHTDPVDMHTDSIMVHPDSLWNNSEFTNTYSNER
ncbi:MAG: hypothetical protein K9J25_06075 [Bacteroidales bacterium]|nr:hypothetical protein [Bacteroidales bacterium]